MQKCCGACRLVDPTEEAQLHGDNKLQHGACTHLKARLVGKASRTVGDEVV